MAVCQIGRLISDFLALVASVFRTLSINNFKCGVRSQIDHHSSILKYHNSEKHHHGFVV